LLIENQHPVHIKYFEKAIEFEMRKYIGSLIENFSKPLKKVGVLISGNGSNLQALIDATKDPKQHIGAEIVLVISNKDNVEGLRRAERAGIVNKV
jgi:phosphoribosylamine--glycine ligase/phosphoribosylglycinamide formyltransferase/phosphoribosylformylglycinamidine cyclo-ligase